MAKTITAAGEQRYKYIARYLNRVAPFGVQDPVELWAVSDYQARKMADGIARSNNWSLTSVGRA